MTDLAIILRNNARVCEQPHYAELFRKAADEIERLRGELAEREREVVDLAGAADQRDQMRDALSAAAAALRITDKYWHHMPREEHLMLVHAANVVAALLKS